MPSDSRSMTRNLETLDNRTVKTRGGHCSADAVRRRAPLRSRELVGPEALGRGGDLGPDGLAVVGQCDELHRERGPARIAAEVPQGPERLRRRQGLGLPARALARPGVGTAQGTGRPWCGSSSGRAGASTRPRPRRAGGHRGIALLGASASRLRRGARRGSSRSRRRDGGACTAVVMRRRHAPSGLGVPRRSDVHPAVDADDLPGDVAGFVRAEVRAHARDVLRRVPPGREGPSRP